MATSHGKVLFEGDFRDASGKHPAKTVPLRGGSLLTLRPFELVVPILIAPANVNAASITLDPFPAKIDTGFEHNLAVSYHQFTQPAWANQDLRHYSPAHNKTRRFRFGDGRPADLFMYDADIWIVSNRTKVDPLEINLDGGFAIFPDEVDDDGNPVGPRVPLLGNRALSSAGIVLEVDYANRQFTLFTV